MNLEEVTLRALAQGVIDFVGCSAHQYGCTAVTWLKVGDHMEARFNTDECNCRNKESNRHRLELRELAASVVGDPKLAYVKDTIRTEMETAP